MRPIGHALIERVLSENPDYAERLARLATISGISLEDIVNKALKDYLDYVEAKERRTPKEK